ncbi:MAG: S8 family serine peptidase [Blastocatellia bacterium]|nr:S8 family serine peptidase [Blastocatellia bacterium]
MKVKATALTLLWVLMLLATSTERRSQALGRDSFRAGEINVGLIPGAEIEAFNLRYGTSVLEEIPGADQYRLRLPLGETVEAALAKARLDPTVLFADPNYYYLSPEVRQTSQAFVDQTSQAFVDNSSPAKFWTQGTIANLRITEAHAWSRGTGVRVAVIDTGLDLDHPLFAGRITGPVYDFVSNDLDPSEEMGGPSAGHGTFVAGLIALTAPEALIQPVRAFNRDGRGTSFDIAKAIRFAGENGAQVINMSFGLLQEDRLIKEALGAVYENSYMVASAGNDNLNLVHFPAGVKSKALSVTSTTVGDRKAAFANYDVHVQAAAPGENLFSAYPGNRWAVWSGTSFSTALVSGEAALLLALDPYANRSRLNEVIRSSGVNINSLNAVYAGKLGRRIDPLAAIRAILLRD